MLEKVVAFVVHKDECGEVFHANFPNGFHSQFRIFHALDAFDVVLRKDGCRSSDASEVEAAIFLASIGHLLRAVSFCQHHHASAVALEKIDIRVHSSCGCRSHGAARHSGRCFCRTGVVYGMIFEIFRKVFAFIDAFFELRMRDVARLLHYGWLVGSGRPEYMRVALEKLNRERESLCRRLGMPQPGVDLFGDVPEIRDAYARRELRFDHALRLAEVERAERAMREREMLEAEKGRQAMALFSDMADFMKTLGRYLQPYAAQADHPAKMRRIYEYMSAPGWADEFVANVPRPMWARHVKYLYDNLALPPAKADTVTPVRSSPVAFGRPAGNPAGTGAQRIMQRMEEMGL